MNYLIDTHTLLWVLFSDEKLSTEAKKVLLDSGSEVFVSAISIWEISLKYATGKLKLEERTPDELPNAVENLGFSFLNLDPITASTFYKLPRLKHRDPFDRMLAWQAISEDFTLISKDKGFDYYQKDGLKRVW